MNEVADAPSFELYPVPATGNVTIASEALVSAQRVEILDATGQLVRALRPSRAPTMEMDITALSPGIYLLQLVAAEGRSCRRLVVE
jgi:hypothetical protein